MIVKMVLILITTSFVPYGGLTTVMMNYYRAMDKKGLKIDFASTNNPPEVLLKELNKNGSRYFNLGDRKKHLGRYLANLDNVLKENHYDVIHVNGNSATMVFELKIAKKRGVSVRIAHGHNTKSDYSWLHRILFHSFRRSYTHAIAVSDKAGEWLFPGEKYIILNNAIPIEKYRYDVRIREEYRNKLGLSGKFVVGNVGKLNKQKNQSFLIELFSELKKQREQAHLLIVGGGSKQKELEAQCKRLGLQKEVTFLGMREDVPELLQAMDIFVFPSLYEGLPLAMLEAQAAGLPLLVSYNITQNAKCTERTFYKLLSDGAREWAEEIIKIAGIGFDREEDMTIKLQNKGFNIAIAAEKMKKIYTIEHKEVSI